MNRKMGNFAEPTQPPKFHDDLSTFSPHQPTMTTDDEDDYLTMTFEEPEPNPQNETYSQRRARKLREHETMSHIKPAKELEVERREEGLAKNMFEEKATKETKAMKMMKLMGYK